MRLLHEGIVHVEDLDLEDFIRVVQNISKMVATEKLDGVNLWFGIDEQGKLYTSRAGKSKSAENVYNPDDYPYFSANNGLRATLAALKARETDIKQVLTPGDTVEVEVLYGRQPNAVTYGAGGKNYIAFIRGVEGTADAKVDQLATTLANSVVGVKTKIVDTIDGEKLDLTDADLSFQFVGAQKIDSKKLADVDVNKQLGELEKFLREPAKLEGYKGTNFDLITASLGSIDKEARPAAKELKARLLGAVMQNFKLPIKKELLSRVVHQTKPALAADDLHPDEDLGVEGVVLRDPVSGDQIKLVDKDNFTTINQFNHAVRNTINALVRTTSSDASLESQGGIMGKLKIAIGDLVGNKELARTVGAKKIFATLKGPTPQATVKNVAKELGGEIEDFLGFKRKVIALIDSTQKELAEQLKDFKANKDNFQLKLKSGKSIGLSPEIIRRTLLVFAESKRDLDELQQKLKKVQSMDQFIALMYGRIAKAVHAEDDKQQVAEGEVVKADFSRGKGVETPGIDVPKGYDRFEVDGKKIVGIKGDRKTVVSSTSDERLAQELVRVYNGGKASVSIKPLTMLQAFGSSQLNLAHDLGIKLVEKPSYWEDLSGADHVDDVKLKRLEKELEKNGHSLPTYSASKLYGSDYVRGPLQKVVKLPGESMVIVKFDDGRRYLADTTGANTYIRMWAPVGQKVTEELLLEKRFYTDKERYKDKSSDGWTLLNVYLAVVMMSAVIYQAGDKPGIRHLRDKAHARLTGWSKEMSELNFWGLPVWRVSQPAVKKLITKKAAGEIFRFSRQVPHNAWRFMHLEMSFGKDIDIDWKSHQETLEILLRFPGLKTDRVNSLLADSFRYGELTYDEKVKLITRLYYYVSQFIPTSWLFTRLKKVQDELLLNPNGNNGVMVQESDMKLLQIVTRLSEDGDGGGAAAGGATTAGAVASVPTGIGQRGNMVRRVRNPEIAKMTRKFKRPTEDTKQ